MPVLIPPRPIISFLLVLLVLLLPTGAQASCLNHQICRRGEAVPNLFVYSTADVDAFLKRNKYSYTAKNLSKLDRNSSGTLLYFSFEDATVLVADVNGIQRKLKKPARGAFLNDAGEFVAWTDDYNKGVNFRDGYTLKLPKFAGFGMDSGGDYYFTQSGSQPTEIFRTDKPGMPLASAKFSAQKMFVKNQKIYLFGSNRRNIRGPGDYEVFEVIGNIFTVSAQTAKFEREIKIPRPSSPGASPFTILDLDAYSDQILLLDVFDDPFPSKFYLGGLNSNKLANLGTTGDYAYFLKSDILQGK